MTVIKQQVGGSAANQDAYVGSVRQLTVDTDNWDIRLHDGSTAGGHRILNRDNNDARYQLKSPELSGLSFNPEERGMVVRLGTGNYRIRQWTWNTNQLTITNPNGYGGNPYITLNTRIETPHIFGDDLIVEGVLQVDGGINANTSGTHVGPVTGNVTGDVTGNLTGDANGDHTGTFTGDVDVSSGTLLLADGQIPIAKIDGLLAYIKANAEEVGMIKMWNGSAASIPAGWALCNGLNGTPDLTDKFIIGAGSLNYSPGDTGGSATHTHSNTIDAAAGHTHTITVAPHVLTENEMPAHRHLNGCTEATNDVFSRGTATSAITTSRNIDSDGSNGIIEGYTETIGGGAGHSHTGTADAGGSHTHTLNNVAASTLPPYYALCFIMRVAS